MLKYQKGYIFNGHTFVVNKEDVHNATDDMFVEATALLPEDVVKVVRCKDCRRVEKDHLFGGYWCRGYRVRPYDFCSYGEPREGDGNG